MKTWIKLYTEILSDPKMGRMSDKLFRRTIELFLLAGKEDGNGVLPEVNDIAWSLHTTAKEIQTVLEELTGLKIIERKNDRYLITHFESRQNSDLTRSEINKRYYENSKNRKSENKTEIQTEVRPDSDVAMSENQTLEEEVEVEEELINTHKVNAHGEKQAFGSFGNVMLTGTEYAKLCERFPDADGRIEHFSAQKQAKGYKYVSDYAAILSWANKDSKKAQTIPAKAQAKKYSFTEVGEMLERGEIVL